MRLNLRARWLNLLHTLWFLPSLISAAYIALAATLVRLDDAEHYRNAWVFAGDGQAARTVLSVIAGSLITVAGLTFSLMMIVLQLGSSQFSPRIVRTYLGDRIAQVTIGSFVGIFAYCLLALRSIGDTSREGTSVPRLTVTVASGLALFALAMLITFIHHIAQLVQASELTTRLGREALAAVERLCPEPFGATGGEADADVLRQWRSDGRGGIVCAERAGFVQSVELGALTRRLPEPRPRVHVLVAPGDFAYADEPIAEVWPPAAERQIGKAVRRSIVIGGERDIDQDPHFAIRQLTDIALRAISPGINDPTTAATCIAHIRSVLTRLAVRELPSPVSCDGDGVEPVVVRRRTFPEYLEAFAEIGRYAGGDARVAGDLLAALSAVAAAAAGVQAYDRARAAVDLAEAVAEQALDEASSTRDRSLVEAALRRVEKTAVGA